MYNLVEHLDLFVSRETLVIYVLCTKLCSICIFKNISVFQKPFPLLSRNYTTSATLECINSFRNFNKAPEALSQKSVGVKKRPSAFSEEALQLLFVKESLPILRRSFLICGKAALRMHVQKNAPNVLRHVSHVFNPTAEDFLLHQPNFYRYPFIHTLTKGAPMGRAVYKSAKEGCGHSFKCVFNH